ncbi:MAG: hypothetical protein ACRCUE_00605 [Bosea sp. (in: a-proteobacteria)]
MDFITKIAKGLAAVQATVGSDELEPKQPLTLEAGGTLNLQARRKRETSQRIMRLETPLGEGLARIDLSAADARALAEALLNFANTVADDAKPVADLAKQPE